MIVNLDYLSEKLYITICLCCHVSKFFLVLISYLGHLGYAVYVNCTLTFLAELLAVIVLPRSY